MILSNKARNMKEGELCGINSKNKKFGWENSVEYGMRIKER